MRFDSFQLLLSRVSQIQIDGVETIITGKILERECRWKTTKVDYSIVFTCYEPTSNNDYKDEREFCVTSVVSRRD